MSTDLMYWIWLSERLGPANRLLPGLLAQFGSVYDIYRADDEELMGFDFDGIEKRSALADKNLDSAYRTLDYCARKGILILTPDSPNYPNSLRVLQNPPSVLYCRGKLPDFEKRLCLSVVGTRKMTEYGKCAAYKIAYELSAAGVIVVSGMALGIDAMAACGALSASGQTVAVFGSGIDRIYPAKHRKLRDKILENGCTISEFPPDAEPKGYHFPIRNRIIS